MGIWRQHFHWSILLRWEVLGWILGILPAIAALFLVFDQYQGANVCFVLTSIFLFAKVAHAGIVANDPWVHRTIFTFLLFGLVGIGIVETVRGVNKWAAKKEAGQQPQNDHPQPEAKGPDSAKLEAPIVVNPTNVTFDQSGELYSFSITNKSDKDVYAIALILRIEQLSISAVDFAFDVPQSSLKALDQQSLNPDIKFADIAGAAGRDYNNAPIFLLRFHHLVPGESRQINLTLLERGHKARSSAASLPEKIDLSKDANVNVTTEIMSYSLVQKPIQKRDGVLLLPLEIKNGALTVDHGIVCFKRDNGPACEFKTVLQPATLPIGQYFLSAISGPDKTPKPKPAIRIVSEKSLASADSELPFGLELTIVSDKDVAPWALTIEFSGEVGKIYATKPFGVFEEEQGGIVAASPNTILLERKSPAFGPKDPMVVTVYSKTEIRAVKMQSIPFNFPYPAGYLK